MKKITFILMATALLFTTACSNSSKNNQDNREATNPSTEEVVAEVNSGKANSFVDTNGNMMTVTYDTSGEAPIAIVTYLDYQEVMLAQIPGSAWAKGAEYENEAMKWIAKENGGKLIIDGKATNFDFVE
ncbi:MAG: hypothetical protein Q4G63_11975 [Bacteroidia bacterium]|nr:hypothetical protein [Bacteroidia bacterium]